ncbi:MAG: hypothetical protein A2898_02545 [Candidatus Kerfeldbacteria bacterium RIFCSPLOWO2_01_FULL_48_11]|uniref:Uncharacterized protein n=1 Tax=Candidatus Kerfeldbacteria bacterium RIFCSPLOWO2_01_FULL_48_11 TaxID=1798543 RepID=A0A1G2B1R6_9BACT|nr:MAG: hypothetical protein UY52_C0022G0019 [Parcubacteria group bacterium GW2011_GWC2_49_9]OGY83131.1 MAG: hypothetical protein A2898_02545 [Candidatus Kerfeldbacteria bacterium RIFCSPLOWO2_01_FULL_48_11]HCJ52240.1 hypothetical protein [Candidatus Kerfeldbacteria bacterium]
MEQQTATQTKTQSTVFTVTLLVAACIAAGAVGFAFFVTKNIADDEVTQTTGTTSAAPMEISDIYDASVSFDLGVDEEDSGNTLITFEGLTVGSGVTFGEYDAYSGYADGNSAASDTPLIVRVASDPSHPAMLATLRTNIPVAMNDSKIPKLIPEAQAQVGIIERAVCLPAKVAVSNHCTNGLLDGDETGVDCGGADCPACPQTPCAASQCRNASGQCVNQTNATCGINGSACVNCVTSGKTCDSTTGTCTAGTAMCGNGVIDAGEQCDGANLGGKTCVTQGFSAGTLSCSPTCTFNTSACTQTPCAAAQCRNASGQCVNRTNATCGNNGVTCVACGTGEFCASDGTCECTIGQTRCIESKQQTCVNNPIAGRGEWRDNGGTCTTNSGASLLFGIPTAHAQVDINGNTNTAPIETTIYYVDINGNTYSDAGLTNRLNTVDCQTLVRKSYAPTDIANITASGSLNLGLETYAYFAKDWSAPLGGFNSTNGFIDLEADTLSLAPLFVIGGNNTGAALTTPEMTLTVTENGNVNKNLCLPLQKELPDGDWFLYFYDTNGKPYTDLLLQQPVACGETRSCKTVNCSKQPYNVCCRYQNVAK